MPTVADARKRMDAALEAMRREFATVRTGKATPALLDTIRVEAYGSQMPINQLATVSTPESSLLVVQPFDRGTTGAIEKELLRSDLGMTPNSDGSVIRLPVPLMTQERRLEMIKRLKRLQEDAHVAVRNVRRDHLEQLRAMERAKEMSQDDLHRSQEQLQKITDEHVARADAVGARKEAELKEV